jgi:hypothetical protein
MIEKPLASRPRARAARVPLEAVTTRAAAPLPAALEDEVVELLAQMLVADLRASRKRATTQGDADATDVPPRGNARGPDGGAAPRRAPRDRSPQRRAPEAARSRV